MTTLNEAKTELDPRALPAVGIQLVSLVRLVVAPALGLRLILRHPSAAALAANLTRPCIRREPPMQISYERHANIITGPAPQSPLHTPSIRRASPGGAGRP